MLVPVSNTTTYVKYIAASFFHTSNCFGYFCNQALDTNYCVVLLRLDPSLLFAESTLCMSALKSSTIWVARSCHYFFLASVPIMRDIPKRCSCSRWDQRCYFPHIMGTALWNFMHYENMYQTNQNGAPRDQGESIAMLVYWPKGSLVKSWRQEHTPTYV